MSDHPRILINADPVVLAHGELLDVGPIPQPCGHHYWLLERFQVNRCHRDVILKVSLVRLLCNLQINSKDFADWSSQRSDQLMSVVKAFGSHRYPLHGLGSARSDYRNDEANRYKQVGDVLVHFHSECIFG